MPRPVILKKLKFKNDRMISVHLQGKPFNITVIQVYASTSNAEKTEVERFYEDLQDLLFYFIFNFYFYFILLYNTVLVLPYIDMNSPRVYMRSQPTRPFRTNTKKRCPFQYRGLECKSRKSRNTWSNSAATLSS